MWFKVNGLNAWINRNQILATRTAREGGSWTAQIRPPGEASGWLIVYKSTTEQDCLDWLGQQALRS